MGGDTVGLMSTDESGLRDPIGAADRRRQALCSVTLRTVVREHLGISSSPDGDVDTPSDGTSFPPGAALVRDGAAWVLLDRDPGRHLGAALAWALRRHAVALEVIAERDAGTLARRARSLTFPIRVWQRDGRRLVEAAAAPLPTPGEPDPAHLSFAEVIEGAGAEVVIEHGVVTGEVLGLEVCRVVSDAVTGQARLEVGLGAHDRELFALVHGEVPTTEALCDVVGVVSGYRGAGARRHPLGRIAPERLLRSRLVARPSTVGAVVLGPSQPPMPRADITRTEPCVATGIDDQGVALTVVCSAGVDLDVVPYAIDARLASASGERAGASLGVDDDRRVVIAVPSRDRLAVTVELARLVSPPIEVVPVDLLD